MDPMRMALMERLAQMQQGGGPQGPPMQGPPGMPPGMPPGGMPMAPPQPPPMPMDPPGRGDEVSAHLAQAQQHINMALDAMDPADERADRLATIARDLTQVQAHGTYSEEPVTRTDPDAPPPPESERSVYDDLKFDTGE